MDMSFYAATAGAQAQQLKMDIIANNMVNLNTTGYKTKNVVFSDLMYENLMLPADEATNLKQGSGARVDKTNTNFDKGPFQETGGAFDYYIQGDGFFAVEDPATKERTYTLSGNFSMSELDGEMYLANADGHFVIGENNEPIILGENADEVIPTVWNFLRTDRLVSSDGSEITSMDGEVPTIIESEVIKGGLEGSNVDTAQVMTKIIESQRAYQYALKMVQTADEIQNIINTLR